mgnify:CR=1 FL=1
MSTKLAKVPLLVNFQVSVVYLQVLVIWAVHEDINNGCFAIR